jgi:hypothetical protein
MRTLEVAFPEPCGERWETMSPSDCNRHCATCDKTIHDLESYRFEEVEALVAREAHVCVRAKIGADGAVKLKRSSAQVAGRLVLAASAGILAVATPAFAQSGGSIVGNIDGVLIRARVTAPDANGRTYRAAVRNDGKFWFKNLPAGEYEVSAQGCEAPWTIGKVTVSGGKVVMARSVDPSECIIVGLMQVKRTAG